MVHHLRTSVRELVAHSLRHGDLNLESAGPSSSLDGIRGHQKVQSSRPEGYQKEVAVSRTVRRGDFELEVGGRIDGVLEADGRVVVEEIKTTRRELSTIQENENLTHWGQVNVYGYLYAKDHGLDVIHVRLTYYHLESGESREFERQASVRELEAIFDDLTERYLAWAERIRDWSLLRDESVGEMRFPFAAYRPGQREIAVQVYRAVQRDAQLLVRAPTGIGKTLATLFPAMKALGKSVTDKVFYLTSRTTGRELAESAIQEMSAGGLRVKSITLTAKDKICFNPEKACNGDECDFARGFYDRIDDALEELFATDAFSRDVIESVARRHRLCPFELSLELSLWCDVVICDYNYVFDPRAYLRRFFDDVRGRYTFLVDEAHNLVDRAREMYSAELRKRDVLSVRRSLDKRHRALRRSLHDVNRFLLEVRRETGEDGARASKAEAPEAMYPLLKTLLRQIEHYLTSPTRESGSVPAAVLDLYFAAVSFLRVSERYDERYVTCYEVDGRDLRIKLFCTDPSTELSETLTKARAAVFFSATLAPMRYFQSTLGTREDARPFEVPSPFPRENLCVVVAEHIATTYRRRDDTLDRLTDLLAAFVRSRPGNYLVYFPSYLYMRACLERFPSVTPELTTLVQRPDMDERERSLFLEQFQDTGDGHVVAFAVMGGFFGEGIDLVGERLTGAAVVGVGLPTLSPERERIRDHFERSTAAGFDYAYVFPGLNRVLQAAGRVIRTETDRGVVLLVDERFAERRYRHLLPKEWSPITVRNERELTTALDEFWVPDRVSSRLHDHTSERDGSAGPRLSSHGPQS